MRALDGLTDSFIAAPELEGITDILGENAGVDKILKSGRVFHIFLVWLRACVTHQDVLNKRRENGIDGIGLRLKPHKSLCR